MPQILPSPRHTGPAFIIVTPPPQIATMAAQDDLATLFAKNLTLEQNQYQQQQPVPEEQDPGRIIYVSQHYTHSAHVNHMQQQPQTLPQSPVQRPSSEPDLADLEHTLRSCGVDPAALSPPQAELFRRADDAQRARLIELWTICPPPASSPSTLTFSPTSVEQEEALARQRWDEAHQQEQQLLQQQQDMVTDDVAMSLDADEAASPVSMGSPSSVQSPDGRWPASPRSDVMTHAHTYMEPYMQSGYEELARREYDATAGNPSHTSKTALDPVYKATGMLDWERQQWMENQYGSFVGAWRDDEDML